MLADVDFFTVRERLLSGRLDSRAAPSALASATGCRQAVDAANILVPARRVELPTFALRMRCSTN
jgi:hypothetical protein